MTNDRDPEDHSNPASMRNPPLPVRLISAFLMNRVIDPKRQAKARAKAEALRRKSGMPHIVDYFHQTDDPYSHLAIQLLRPLLDRYDIELRTHLIRGSGGKNQPRYEELAAWARRDVDLIAEPYGVTFPSGAPTVPSSDLVSDAERALAILDPHAFADIGPRISEAAWSGDEAALAAFPKAAPDVARASAAEGSALLKKMHHYSGAMFHYHGEWYWGADRLDHLETHLRQNGAARRDSEDLIVTRPMPDVTGVDAKGLTLHFYPSLNSPYTAIIYDQSIALREACGINLLTKPVLPMVMRGVPATMDKIRYIMFDTKREADRNGVAFGPIIPPIGTPVIKSYSLFPWTDGTGKTEALLGELLRRAFSQAAPLHTEAGLKAGIEAAGVDWAEAQAHMGSEEWREGIADHQDEMIVGMNFWGVPCYRLEGPGDEPPLDVWGQDRLWVITEEIKRRAGAYTDSQA
ncbi:MAG: DsbA family protein [Pseudomonadota bacterium]